MKLFRKKNADENYEIWSAISDLMSVLMMIFMFISIAFMLQLSKENIKIKEEQETVMKIVDTYDNIKIKIYDALYEEFKEDINKWKIEINKDDLSIRFKEPDVFFKRGSSTLTSEYKEVLENFFPRYINVLYKDFNEYIEEIRIEGHTSSEWTYDVNPIQSYFYNMELSQDRTREVMKYVMTLNEMSFYNDWLIEHLTANGLSYSKRIYKNDGTEDKEYSRRVEFKIRTKSEDIIYEIINEYRR